MGYTALAEEGFMILAERLRSGEERDVVAQVLAKVLKVQPDMEQVGASGGGRGVLSSWMQSVMWCSGGGWR